MTLNTPLDGLPNFEALPVNVQALVRTALTSNDDHDARVLDTFLDTTPILKPIALLIAYTYFKPYEVQ